MKLSPIATIHSPFKEKFAIPRQPRLAPAATAIIELLPPYNDPLALVGLEQVSHIWLLFQFHAINPEQIHLRVRPPRLGGNTKIGVFATRSTHRPNSIGMSVVKLEAIEGCKLFVSGVDLLDGTPIVDIKPYVPYSDSLPDAHNEIADSKPQLIQVTWPSSVLKQAQQAAQRLNADVVGLIEQCLAQDPKPAYQQPNPERLYGVKLWDLNIRWRYINAGMVEVVGLESAWSEARG